MNKEQQILLDYLVRTYSPTAIEEYVFTGDISGGDLATYDANTLYFALDLTIFSTNALATSGSRNGEFFDETNTNFAYLRNTTVYFDTVASAAGITYNDYNIKNIYFSRMTCPSSSVKFIGFKLTIP